MRDESGVPEEDREDEGEREETNETNVVERNACMQNDFK